MSAVLATVLRQREAQCPVIRSISRELLTCLVMQPIMNLASPGYVVEYFVLYFFCDNSILGRWIIAISISTLCKDQSIHDLKYCVFFQKVSFFFSLLFVEIIFRAYLVKQVESGKEQYRGQNDDDFSNSAMALSMNTFYCPPSHIYFISSMCKVILFCSGFVLMKLQI